MKITGDLIDRFLAGQCSAEETAMILDILQTHPELLDEYIGRGDWDRITQGDAVDMPAAVQQRMHARVLQATIKKKTAIIYKMKRVWVAAAACIAVALVSWFLYRPHTTERAVAAKSPATRIQQKATVPADTTINNPGKNKLRIALKDGSVVLLSSHSGIRYQKEFAGPQRNIFLQGEGYFEVAKDKQRPFTVYSNGISTTALGTAFTIRAFDNSHEVKVNLYAGKVVVRKAAKKNMHDTAVYLLPGDQLTINTLNNNTGLTKTSPSFEKQQRPVIPYPAVKELVFDREPLSGVFKQLEQRFNTSFLYEEQSLATLSFTGTIQPKDSLEKVLDRIAFLNSLTIIKTQKGYDIRIKQ